MQVFITTRNDLKRRQVLRSWWFLYQSYIFLSPFKKLNVPEQPSRGIYPTKWVQNAHSRNLFLQTPFQYFPPHTCLSLFPPVVEQRFVRTSQLVCRTSCSVRVHSLNHTRNVCRHTAMCGSCLPRISPLNGTKAHFIPCLSHTFICVSWHTHKMYDDTVIFNIHTFKQEACK